jgi:glucosamine-6-phosphate deaminase
MTRRLRRRRYEQCILAHGGIELFLAGIGHDGHIAFNEPGAQHAARAKAARATNVNPRAGSSLTSRTREKTLNQETIEANCR